MPWNRLAVTVLLCGWGLGSLGAQDKPAPTPAETEAIAALKKLGGLVLEIAQNDPRLDIGLHLADAKITDAELAPVAALPRTAHLNLRGTEVTDAGLAHLKDLKGLTKLHLEKTKVTDAGLAHLSGLENLEYLNLYGTAVGDEGLKALVPLKKLKKLYLWETKVTDAGVAALKAELPELKINRGAELAAPKPEEPKPEEPKPAEEKKE
jgi:hypothetical protein